VSEDSSQTWYLIAEDIIESNFNWSTKYTVDGTGYKIKILVTDGVNTAWDISDGTFTIHPTGIDDPQFLNKLWLSQNYPNPFSESTIIEYSLEEPCFVTFEIYDLVGRRQLSLVSEYQNPGEHSLKFSGDDLPSGVYFYKLRARGYEETNKFVLIK
jgi:hypothetical protein